VLADCRIGDVQTKIINQLSRGYRQRVAIADALLVNPPYLIMDEPTLGLDPVQVRQLRMLLKEIGRDRTIIFSTHILSEVDVICDSIIVIHEGRIVERGRVEDVRKKAIEAGGGALENPTLEEVFVALVETRGKNNGA
jgi:ABC-2 type transport system ATP-binding protein